MRFLYAVKGCSHKFYNPDYAIKGCMPRLKYTREEYEEVLRLRSLGYGYSKISKITGIPGRTIYGWYAENQEPYCMWSNEKKQKRMKAIKRGCDTPEYRQKLSLSKMSSKNPMWKGDQATPRSARRRAQRRYPAPPNSERHHTDGNPYNNEPENIDLITRREHMIKDGRMKKLLKINHDKRVN